MGILLRKCILLFVIMGPAVILPGAFGVEQRDYEEALKEDEQPESLQQSERSTEYPNGVNVIPGSADIHYPTYDKIPKSAFSCHGRIPGFYADPELRCQVWHICDESGVQQSFLCTNGTIYSQDKRVCDWWYNVNCDPEEVARNYAANSELYKGPPPKDGNAYEETPNNDLPPPPPPSHKKPVQQQQQHRPQQQHQQQRPQNHEQQPQQQRQPQHQQQPQRHSQHTQQPQRQQQQNYERPTQRPQNENYNNDQPQQTREQQQDEEERASALKILQAYEQQSQPQQQSSRPQNQNYENKPQQSPEQQRAQEQKRAEALKVIQNYERAQSQYRPQNYEIPQARRQPTASQQNSNYVAPTAPTRSSYNTPPPPPNPNGGAVPEKKRVIVLRLPGPLPPGATIPPHILMEYAESVLAAERAGKAPPPGLVSSKTVTIPQSQQRPQAPPQQQQQHHNQHQHQHRPQQQHQTRPQQSAPTQPTPTEASSPAPPQRVRPSPKGPTLPYTPRPFSAFLEAAVKHNGQSKNNAAPVQQQQQPQQQQTPQPTPQPQQQQQHRPQQSQNQQQRRYEEPRQTPRPQNYEQQPPQQKRPTQQQPTYQQPEETSYPEEQPRQQQQQPTPQKKTPVQHKPSKSGPPPSAVDSKKFRHSTPRKHGEIKFAPKSSVNFDDLEEHVEESRRPAYFNNLAPVPHLAQDFYSTARPVQPTYQTQPPKADVHLKSSFDEVEKVNTRTHRVKQQYQEPIRTTSTTERYLTAEEIHEPAIKRLVVVAGLKIKDPRNKQLTTPNPFRASGSSEEETYSGERNYEPVRVIVARKSTTTSAPETTTTTTTRTPLQQQYQHQQRNHHHQRHQQQPITTAPTTAAPLPQENPAPAPRVRPTPKGPTLPYTPRPFSAFLEAAVKYNGQSKGSSTPAPQPVAELEPQVYEETTPKPVMRRVIRKKIRVNHNANNHANLNSENIAQNNHGQPEVQTFQKIPRTTTYTPVQTTRKSTTTTTPYYQPEDYYDANEHSTKATKNFGFDVYGRNEDEDEDEELVRAAQEYYQFSENYGKKQRY